MPPHGCLGEILVLLKGDRENVSIRNYTFHQYRALRSTVKREPSACQASHLHNFQHAFLHTSFKSGYGII